jgi:hypothetical protein
MAGARSEAAVIARGCAERLGTAGKAGIWFGVKPAAGLRCVCQQCGRQRPGPGRRAPGCRRHPGAAVIPAVLAVAQDAQAGWPRVLAALVAGYEVGVRISAAQISQPRHAFDRKVVCLWRCRRGRPPGTFREGKPLKLWRWRHTVSRAFRRGLQHGHGQPCQGGHPLGHLTGLWAVELARWIHRPLDILDHSSYFNPDRITTGPGSASLSKTRISSPMPAAAGFTAPWTG